MHYLSKLGVRRSKGVRPGQAGLSGATIASMAQLRTSEAAAFLGVGRATLRRLEDRGSLHPSRDARGYRMYSLAELERIAEQRSLLPEELEAGTGAEHKAAGVGESQRERIQDPATAALAVERQNLESRRIELERRELDEREAALITRQQARQAAEHQAEFGEARKYLLRLYQAGKLKSLYLMSSADLRMVAKALRPIGDSDLARMGRYDLRKIIQSELPR